MCRNFVSAISVSRPKAPTTWIHQNTWCAVSSASALAAPTIFAITQPPGDQYDQFSFPSGISCPPIRSPSTRKPVNSTNPSSPTTIASSDCRRSHVSLAGAGPKRRNTAIPTPTSPMMPNRSPTKL